MPATMPVTEKGSLFDNGLMAYAVPKALAKEGPAKSAESAASAKPNFMWLAGFLKTDIHLSDVELEEAISEARITAAIRGADDDNGDSRVCIL